MILNCIESGLWKSAQTIFLKSIPTERTLPFSGRADPRRVGRGRARHARLRRRRSGGRRRRA